MVRGSCLCGGVRFEIDSLSGPFELCHCSRCRKVSGSAYMAAVGVRRKNFRFLCGQDLICVYEAPLVESPPAYRVCFCRKCGSCVPDPHDTSESVEVAAGMLDDDPLLRPDKHIFVEFKAAWDEIHDTLPQLDKPALLLARKNKR